MAGQPHEGDCLSAALVLTAGASETESDSDEDESSTSFNDAAATSILGRDISPQVRVCTRRTRMNGEEQRNTTKKKAHAALRLSACSEDEKPTKDDVEDQKRQCAATIQYVAIRGFRLVVVVVK